MLKNGTPKIVITDHEMSNVAKTNKSDVKGIGVNLSPTTIVSKLLIVLTHYFSLPPCVFITSIH